MLVIKFHIDLKLVLYLIQKKDLCSPVLRQKILSVRSAKNTKLNQQAAFAQFFRIIYIYQLQLFPCIQYKLITK